MLWLEMLKLDPLTLLYKTTKATILIVAFLFSLWARFTKPRYRTADISEPSGLLNFVGTSKMLALAFELIAARASWGILFFLLFFKNRKNISTICFFNTSTKKNISAKI